MIDLDKLVPLPEKLRLHQEFWTPEVIELCQAYGIAAWNAALDAAIKAVEHEAFPSELPRFRVATDKLRDMRIESEPK